MPAHCCTLSLWRLLNQKIQLGTIQSYVGGGSRGKKQKSKEKKVEKKKNENDDRMVESTWEAEENRGTKQGSTSESELLEISGRKDLLRWTPIFEVSIKDALLYQFCSFIFNMGLTPPPFLNNVKKKRLVQRGSLTNIQNKIAFPW